MGLIGAMIGILADDNYFDLSEVGGECGEYLRFGWVNWFLVISFA